MKKTIKYLAAAASIALFAIASPFAASGANGHIFDILPSDEFGKVISGPVATADSPLGGGEKVNFVVRMMKESNASTSTKWRLKHIGLNSEAVDAALNPFGIGIYVSGEIRIATLKSVLSTGDYFSDFVFEYVTKPGDFALPIVLANKNGQPTSDAAVADLEYYRCTIPTPHGIIEIENSKDAKKPEIKIPVVAANVGITSFFAIQSINFCTLGFLAKNPKIFANLSVNPEYKPLNAGLEASLFA